MADKIRVGIVGATVSPSGSRWGANAHVPALHALPDYELKAVCTAHEDTAKASAAQFGAELAFHNFDEMVAHPDIDLVVVCVRVPNHHDLVMTSLRAGKPTFCEWPLGANLAQAEEMAGLARAKSLRTAVGLQARSDPVLSYAHELVQQGHIGEVLAANLSVTGTNVIERTADRIWQGDRAAGANTLTISGGHAIDAMCYIIGEFAEVTARLKTQVKEWRLTDTGGVFHVTSPDTISFAGELTDGAEVSTQVLSLPASSGGYRLEIHGREGVLLVNGGSANIGPNKLYHVRGREAPTEMLPPDRFNVVPEGTPAGQARNVAQAYAYLADGFKTGDAFEPDFDVAVVRHRLIDALERSSNEGRTIQL